MTNVQLGVLLVIIGIALAMLVHYGLGILVILVGLAILLIPMFNKGTTKR